MEEVACEVEWSVIRRKQNEVKNQLLILPGKVREECFSFDLVLRDQFFPTDKTRNVLPRSFSSSSPR